MNLVRVNAFAFSIHYRIEVIETILPVWQLTPSKGLSVSTIGSKWLKRAYSQLLSVGGSSFSIHYRIEVIETGIFSVIICRWFLFQYPLSDRSDWNGHILSYYLSVVPLSVSTIGSKWLKQHKKVCTQTQTKSFSIHYRIEVIETIIDRSRPGEPLIFQYPLSDRSDWNSPLGEAGDEVQTLSVSTIGSKWLKLTTPMTEPANEMSLSVSTIGSKWLKPCAAPARSSCQSPFSIHYRIEVIETMPVSVITSVAVPFSIHYRIEVIETVWARRAMRFDCAFQYPLSDRSDWNYKRRLSPFRLRYGLSVSTIGSKWLKHGTVSIAYGKDGHFQYPLSDRSDWNFDTYRETDEISSTFQYPLSDRSDWNCRRPNSSATILSLSVSTIGSKWLKRCGQIIIHLHQRHFQYPLSDRSDWNHAFDGRRAQTGWLSVSTIGSKWLKLCLVGYDCVFYICFQYPLSDRSDWNLWRICHCSAPGTLSVSTIGSKWLKPKFVVQNLWQSKHFQYPLSDRSDWNSR